MVKNYLLQLYIAKTNCELKMKLLSEVFLIMRYRSGGF